MVHDPISSGLNSSLVSYKLLMVGDCVPMIALCIESRMNRREIGSFEVSNKDTRNRKIAGCR